MSEEHERFPRIVWDDFAVNAARFGFMASLFWLQPALAYLTFPLDLLPFAVCTVVVGVGAFALALLVGSYSTRYRSLGLAVVGATAVFAGVGLMALTGEAGAVPFSVAAGGYFLGACAVARGLLRLPEGTNDDPEWLTRVRRFQTRYTLTFVALGLAANLPPLALAVFRINGGVVPAELTAVAFWYVVVLSAALCVWCWLWFARPFVEVCAEAVFRVMYRIKARGPGVKGFPPVGPCLVVANHACWFDPVFVGEFMPRPITPIMTARFYNQWFLRPLLKYVIRVIVVPETPLKRETPELEQAVAALDRGEVVVIFPEGYLRRKEEVPLRRFGQGVWRILSARSHTPVVACWVEGGWGSKFSYFNGPPTKNKPMDFRRKIDVAVSLPELVPAEVLSDQMATRIHLMNRVAGMRAVLGLTPLPAFELPHLEGDADAGVRDPGPVSQRPATEEPA